MKNKKIRHTVLRAAGFITLAAIIALTSVSCLSLLGGGGGDGGGTLTLTDIPSKYNGKYARVSTINIDVDMDIFGSGRISGGRAVIPLWGGGGGRGGYDLERYSGSGRFEMGIYIQNERKAGSKAFAYLEFESVRISNGIAKISYIDADEIEEY